jgi:hypothetical protein
MGIALLALSGFFKAFSGVKHQKPLTTPRPSGRIHPSWATRTAVRATPASKATPSVTKAPCLKVLRVRESGDGPQTSGRMVISGRMADVCAELDRLAALEMRHLSH